MLTCKSCGATLDVTMSTCPGCRAELPLGRLTDMLGLVCRSCDAYNDPGARTCVACGQPLGAPASPRPPTPPPVAGPPATAAPAPAPLVAPPPPAAPAPRAAAPAPPPAATAPAPAPRARLWVERGELPVGTAIAVFGPAAQAGSGQTQLSFPRDPCLAPVHASFLFRGGGLVLRDEGAAGGVYVRLRGLTVPLRPGALFSLGDRLLRYAGPLEPAPPPSPANEGVHRMGAPRPDGPSAVVEEWLEGGVAGRTYVRAGPSITIGRAGCAINLGDDPFVSQAHAELALEADGSARLRDLGSSNGTFVRLPPGTERELADGDRVRMGHQVLRVELT